MRARARPARRCTGVAVLLLAATLAAPMPALAQPGAGPPQAGQHFARGVELYKEDDYAGALVEFQRAYDVDPKYQVLYNIAESHYQLQDYASALSTFQRYLEEGGNRIAPRRRKDVETSLETLTRRVATLTITSSEPGATVTIDDVGVGKTPVEGLMVSAGRRRVTATLPDRPPATKIVDLVGGDRQALNLDIPRVPGPIVIREPAQTPAQQPPSIVPPVVMWSVTGALVVGAVITGIVALGASSDLEAELARFPGDADALASAKSSAFGLGLATDILLGTSVAAAAVSTYFTVDFIIASDAAASAQPSPAARLTVHPQGLLLDGRF